MALVQQFDEDTTLNLATLAVKTILSQALKIDASRENGFRVTKSNFHFSVADKTAQEGPVMIGVACNFVNDAAITAALGADPQKAQADDIRGKGTFIKGLFLIGTNVQAYPGDGGAIDGQMIEVSYGKNGWSIPEGSSMVLWAWNMGAAALTTGTRINMYAEHFGVWLRD